MREAVAPHHALGIQAGTVADDRYAPAPIPAAQVLGGQPRARSCDLSSSQDGAVSMNLWDCTAGRFRWYFAQDELIQVLEGEVRVTDEEGRTTILSAGCTAYFPPGTHLVWEVPEYVRKLAIHHAPASKLGRAVRRLQILYARSGKPAAERATLGVAPIAPGLDPVLNGVAMFL